MEGCLQETMSTDKNLQFLVNYYLFARRKDHLNFLKILDTNLSLNSLNQL